MKSIPLPIFLLISCVFYNGVLVITVHKINKKRVKL